MTTLPKLGIGPLNHARNYTAAGKSAVALGLPFGVRLELSEQHWAILALQWLRSAGTYHSRAIFPGRSHLMNSPQNTCNWVRVLTSGSQV